jgi:hypothetical protein
MAGGPALAEVNCTSAPDNTYPRIKLTLCGGSGYPKSFLGASWADGESKILCPDMYNTAGEEEWLFNNNDYFFIQANNFIPSYYTPPSPGPGYGWKVRLINPGSFSFVVVKEGGITLTRTNTLSSAVHNISPPATETDQTIASGSFGSVTFNGPGPNFGFTLKWEALDTVSSWKSTTLSYATTSTDSPCP